MATNEPFPITEADRKRAVDAVVKLLDSDDPADCLWAAEILTEMVRQNQLDERNAESWIPKSSSN